MKKQNLRLLHLNKKNVSRLNQFLIRGGEDDENGSDLCGHTDPCGGIATSFNGAACATDRTRQISVCFQHCQDK